MDAQKIFTEIYVSNRWGDPESRSGPGSSVFRTRLVRPALSSLLRNLEVQSVLDLACGDFNWMRFTEMPEILYIGADVVPEIVGQNHDFYANDWRRFVCLNMITDPLPQAELILCRDGLVHLSFADIAATLRQMRSCGARYLLVTTFDEHPTNEDIRTGDWRPLNLQLSPFSFPHPMSKIWDGPRPDGTYRDKMLALYTISDLPVV
jgi:hypothetical protein